MSGMTDLNLFINGQPSAKQYHLPLRGNGVTKLGVRKLFNLC